MTLTVDVSVHGRFTTVDKVLYTVSQKTGHLMFCHNFGKCEPIYKIPSLKTPEETFYVYTHFNY